MRLHLRAALAALALAAPAASQGLVAGDGYLFTTQTVRADQCGGSLSTASFPDGSYLAYDGWSLDHLSAGGLVLRRVASFPSFAFPSFVRIAPDGLTAYVGESSLGAVFAVDLASGANAPLVSIPGNYDLAFDADPGFAYVCSNIFDADFGAGVVISPNEVHRVDLATGAAVRVASFSGFSGPLTVDEAGNLFAGQLPVTFTFPPDSLRVLLFADATLDGPSAATEADATVFVDGLDGLSSMAYDVGKDQLFLAETNTGAGGLDTVVWRADLAGTLVEEVARAGAYSGGLELVDTGAGTKLGPYQPPFTALRFTGSDCFGVQPLRFRAQLSGARPRIAFDGPPVGQSGMASFELTGAVPGGFASLWLARSTSLGGVDLVTDLGGFFPIALRAPAGDFIRRFPLIQVDPNGAASFPYFQDAAIEGGAIAQWIVLDASMTPVTSTDVRLNRSTF